MLGFVLRHLAGLAVLACPLSSYVILTQLRPPSALHLG